EQRGGSAISSVDRVERALTGLIQRAQNVRLYGAGEPQLLERSAYRMLGVIYDRWPLRLTDLAIEFALDLSTVSRQLATLERAGLAYRYRDPADQRPYILRANPRGQLARAERDPRRLARQRRGHVRRVAGSVPRRAAGSLIAARVGDRPGRRAPRLGRARVNPGLSRRQLVAVLIGLI